nr:hypothetical protein [Tanacetum cinerariifolium]
MMNLTTLPLSFWDYALETATCILNMVPTKKVDKTPYELCGRAEELDEIIDEDTSPSENTSEIHMEVEGFEPPQEEVVPIHRSARTRRAPDRLCLNVEVEEHSLTDLIEPNNYKAAILDPKSDKWSKWLIKKKTDVDGSVHTYKARLVAKGFIDPKHPRKICKLQRSIYGPKQASRSKNTRFDEEIKRFGFIQNLDEPFVYQKASESNVTFLILYVDDIIIMENHIPSLQSVKSYLGKCFAMKYLGEAIFILGIKIYRDRSKQLIRLSQSAYMDKILKKYRMDNSKRGNIPMQENLDLNKTQGASTPEEVKRMHNVSYASAAGSIINPKVELRVDCYCDAGFETDRDDIKYQTGHITALEVAMEAVWIRKFILGLGIVPIINELIKMFCDNSAALYFANEPGVQRGARHYHRRYHYVREFIELGKIKLLKVHTNDNLADPFTKDLSKGKLT